MTVHLILKDRLKLHRISAYRLWKASGLSKGTIYALVNGKAEGFDFKTMQTVLDTLSRLTHKAITPNDVLEVVRDA